MRRVSPVGMACSDSVRQRTDVNREPTRCRYCGLRIGFDGAHWIDVKAIDGARECLHSPIMAKLHAPVENPSDVSDAERISMSLSGIGHGNTTEPIDHA